MKKQHKRDFEEVMALINSDADVRLITMIGAGYLETYLAELLKFQLRDMPADARNLLFKRHLRSAESRIEFARAMGLTNETIKHDFHVLAKVRNQFAHHVRAVDCSDPEVSKLIDTFKMMRAAQEDMPGGGASLDQRDRLLAIIHGIVSVFGNLIDGLPE